MRSRGNIYASYDGQTFSLSTLKQLIGRLGPQLWSELKSVTSVDDEEWKIGINVEHDSEKFNVVFSDLQDEQLVYQLSSSAVNEFSRHSRRYADFVHYSERQRILKYLFSQCNPVHREQIAECVEERIKDVFLKAVEFIEDNSATLKKLAKSKRLFNQIRYRPDKVEVPDPELTRNLDLLLDSDGKHKFADLSVDKRWGTVLATFQLLDKMRIEVRRYGDDFGWGGTKKRAAILTEPDFNKITRDLETVNIIRNIIEKAGDNVD